MSRKRIAVRRGVVLGLIVLSVLIFSSFFREDEGGFLHQFKGTVGAIAAPIQHAAVAAVQPIKDGWNWFAELRTARDERNALLVENATLKQQITDQVVDAKRIDELEKLLSLADQGPAGYKPVTARVLTRPPDLSRRALLDKGRDDGVVRNSLVFATPLQADGSFGAIVGIVTSATASSSTVTFLTDPSTAVAAKLLNDDNALGLLRASASGELLVDQVPGSVAITPGAEVVTAGIGTTLLSPYPPNLRIGTVSSSGSAQGEPGEFQTVQVEPYRDPVDLSTFVVFTPVSAEAKRRARP